jgi:hypothetical protein
MYAKITYGVFGSVLVKAVILVNNYGLCCAYFRIYCLIVSYFWKDYEESYADIFGQRRQFSN